MFKLYDETFKIGFTLTVFVFILLNMISYLTKEDELAKRGYESYGAEWGFPVPMANFSYSGIEPFSFSLNIVVFFVCSFITGLLVSFIWSKNSTSKLKYLEMKELIKNKIFLITFFISSIFVISLNIFLFVVFSRCHHCQEKIGIPFSFYIKSVMAIGNGLNITEEFLLGYLILDILFIIAFCFSIGLICSSIWSKFSIKLK